MGKRGWKGVTVTLASTQLTLYAGRRLAQAVEDIVNESTLYEGVKIAQIMEAVYLQGKKDGARTAFEEAEKKLSEAKKQVPHNRPGRPRNK